MSRDLMLSTDASLTRVYANVAGQLAESSAQKYAIELDLFKRWCAEHMIDPGHMTRDALISYQKFLIRRYAPSTAQRKLSIIKRIYDEAFVAGVIPESVTHNLRGVKVSADSPLHIALTREQVDRMLDLVQHNPKRTSILLARDYLILLFLLKTGIRRAELCSLNCGDITTRQGHWIAKITGKGNKRRIVKLLPVVKRAMTDYLALRDEDTVHADAPLLLSTKRNARSRDRELPRLSVAHVWDIVKDAGARIDVPNLTVHSLRATFATLLLNGPNPAPLHKVQVAMGHADPRTTQRYWKNQVDLDDNAVDYLH